MANSCLRAPLVLALVLVAAASRTAAAQDFLNQEWLLDPARSHVYMQTEKLDKVIERDQFTKIEGGVGKDGLASIKIDLGSLDTGIDLRNVRMRFLLFETFRFPSAEITAQLDKSKLQGLSSTKPVNYPLKLKVGMHGLEREIETAVWVTRTGDTTVSVATVNPIVVSADTFDFTGGVAKLASAMGGIPIVPSASITFELIFGTGSVKPALEAARAEREKARAQEAAAPITNEGCETRLKVMTETNAIYFRTASAELDRKSEPLLDAGVDFASRCPSVRFVVEGHTDSVGGKAYNQRLSEQRARSVVKYLTAKGIDAARIQSAGYGNTRPVAPNNSEANRAKNRRIEFKVNGG